MATRQSDEPLPWGEFELIDRLFAPLAEGLAGAFDLKDDVAALPPRPGHELVLKTDSLIEGVHFLPEDPASSVGQKALRRTLSDLAAKGADPDVYLLAIALPVTTERQWLEAFAEGLLRDQKQFGVALAGGETNRTPGALTITITAIGWVPEGKLVRRKGALAGDSLWVTGTIGDAAGGLGLLNDETATPSSAVRDHLVGRFRIPEPRLSFGKELQNFATSAVDVSDGLLADVGHIADASEVTIEVDSAAVPLSPELRALWGISQEAMVRAVSAGDDYEIAFTASQLAAQTIEVAARRAATQVTRIGRVVEGQAAAVLRDGSNREIPMPRKGYTHF